MDALASFTGNHRVTDQAALAGLEAGERAVAAFVERRGRAVELVPSREVVFALVGDRADDLDLAWLSPAGEFSLRGIIRARGLSPAAARTIQNRLRWCYTLHVTAPRHATAIWGRGVTVIPSDRFAAGLRRIVADVLTWDEGVSWRQ